MTIAGHCNAIATFGETPKTYRHRQCATTTHAGAPTIIAADTAIVAASLEDNTPTSWTGSTGLSAIIQTDRGICKQLSLFASLLKNDAVFNSWGYNFRNNGYRLANLWPERKCQFSWFLCCVNNGKHYTNVHALLYFYTDTRLLSLQTVYLEYRQQRSAVPSSSKCTKIRFFGKVDSQEITKITATEYHILKQKCTKFDFGWRLSFTADPAAGGSLQRSASFPSWI